MSLASGTRIGTYEILALIGAGGMGEVYRARDNSLKRDVALKVLPAAFARDPDRMARFQREAEILASLNHPGIATIYGLVEDGETRAIAMELVEGPALACPQPAETAIEYAKQMAEALEYAHDRNVMHRDLKPANVKITSEGRLKLLDFGLAKAIEDPSPGSNPADSPTLTLGHTRAGAILGTAAYMSPEQAVGKPADRRADIFAFGAVLYEMLTGQRAFAGATSGDVLASVVKDQPDWSKLPAETPPNVAILVRRCLHKDRKQRLQAIGEARILLENRETEVADLPRGGLPQSRPAFSSHLPWALAGISATAAGIAFWGWLRPRPAEPKPVTRFTVAYAQSKGQPPAPALSRDGRWLAYRSGGQVQLRSLDQFETKPVAGTEGALGNDPVCFSPDGQWLAYSFAGTQMRKVPITGGAALNLAEGLNGADICHWGDDGNIYFGVSAGIMRVAATGGKAELLAAPDAAKNELSLENPQLLPGAKHVLFSAVTSRGMSNLPLIALNLTSHERKIVLETAGLAEFVSTGSGPSGGHLLYFRDGSLFAAPFDANSLQVGPPAPILNGVAGVGAFGFYCVSESGTLAYLAGGNSELGSSTMVWVDRTGAEQAIPAPARTYNNGIARLSPDGGRVAASFVDLKTLTADLWIYELASGRLTRLTFDGVNVTPVWTPDGKRLVYLTLGNATGSTGELRTIATDNSGPAVKLSSVLEQPGSVSPDVKVALTSRPRGGNSTNDIWVVPLQDSGESPHAFLQSTKFNQWQANFSPDGHWVAYTSNESGKNEVYVVPFPGPGGKTQVSIDGGAVPHWNRNGRELFYRNGQKLMAADVEVSPSFRAGTPKMLFSGDYPPAYDISADGKRFLMTRSAAVDQGQLSELRVVLNWFEELRRLTAARP